MVLWCQRLTAWESPKYLLKYRLFSPGNKLLLRVDCMPSSRWPEESKLNDIFQGSLPYNVLSGPFLLFLLFFFLPYRIFVSIMACSFVFLWVPKCSNEWVSAFISVSCAFSWTFFLLFLSYSNYLVFFYILLPHRCLFVFSFEKRENHSECALVFCLYVWGYQIPWNWRYRQLWAAM